MFDNVLNSFKIIDVEYRVLDVGLAAVILEYDGPGKSELNIRDDVWGRVAFEFSLFWFVCGSIFCKLCNLDMKLYEYVQHQNIVHI